MGVHGSRYTSTRQTAGPTENYSTGSERRTAARSRRPASGKHRIDTQHHTESATGQSTHRHTARPTHSDIQRTTAHAPNTPHTKPHTVYTTTHTTHTTTQ